VTLSAFDAILARIPEKGREYHIRARDTAIADFNAKVQTSTPLASEPVLPLTLTPERPSPSHEALLQQVSIVPPSVPNLLTWDDTSSAPLPPRSELEVDPPQPAPTAPVRLDSSSSSDNPLYEAETEVAQQSGQPDVDPLTTLQPIAQLVALDEVLHSMRTVLSIEHPTRVEYETHVSEFGVLSNRVSAVESLVDTLRAANAAVLLQTPRHGSSDITRRQIEVAIHPLNARVAAIEQAELAERCKIIEGESGNHEDRIQAVENSVEELSRFRHEERVLPAEQRISHAVSRAESAHVQLALLRTT